MSNPSHPAFDSSEQDLIAGLVDQGEDASSDGNVAPSADPTEAVAVAPAPASAPAAAEVAVPAAAAPAPAQAATDAPVPAAEPAPAAVAVATPAPQGDTRAALRASRHAERSLREENRRLAEQVEALRNGSAPADTAITDEELAQLEEDFPLQAKIVRRQRVLEEHLAAQPKPAASAQPEFVAPSYAPEVQDVIDGVPQLLAWQYDPAAQDKFNRAVAYDTTLKNDPDWVGRTVVERFTEAARRAEAALGTPAAAAPATPSAAPAAPAPAAPAATRVDPAAALAALQVQGPQGISDFRGGAPGHTPTLNYSKMSDEAIMASLPVG